MAELFKAGGITESTQDIWFSTLPFYKNPSRSMVGSVLVSILIVSQYITYFVILHIFSNYLFDTYIVDQQEFINVPSAELRHSALLGVSSLVHTFCMATNECEKLSQVQEVIMSVIFKVKFLKDYFNMELTSSYQMLMSYIQIFRLY